MLGAESVGVQALCSIVGQRRVQRSWEVNTEGIVARSARIAVVAVFVLVGAVGAPVMVDGPEDTIGVVDQTSGVRYLRDPFSGATTSFFCGHPGVFPIVGDWDCDGVDTRGCIDSPTAASTSATATPMELLISSSALATREISPWPETSMVIDAPPCRSAGRRRGVSTSSMSWVRTVAILVQQSSRTTSGIRARSRSSETSKWMGRRRSGYTGDRPV